MKLHVSAFIGHLQVSTVFKKNIQSCKNCVGDVLIQRPKRVVPFLEYNNFSKQVVLYTLLTLTQLHTQQEWNTLKYQYGHETKWLMNICLQVTTNLVLFIWNECQTRIQILVCVFVCARDLTCCHAHAWSRHAFDWLQASTCDVSTSHVSSERINN